MEVSENCFDPTREESFPKKFVGAIKGKQRKKEDQNFKSNFQRGPLIKKKKSLMLRIEKEAYFSTENRRGCGVYQLLKEDPREGQNASVVRKGEKPRKEHYDPLLEKKYGYILLPPCQGGEGGQAATTNY